MKVLIIEDERFAAIKLEGLIKAYDPSIEISGPLETVEEAVQCLSGQFSPDLLFLDIHLADGSSFEIFKQVAVDCPIIFTTAYDQYAIQAFKTKSIDYLLKPIKQEELNAAMGKFAALYRGRPERKIEFEIQALAEMLQSNQSKRYKERFLVKRGATIQSIPSDRIAYFHFEDRATLLITQDNHRFPVNQTLDELELVLNPQAFTRANRQFIVHISAIDKIHPWFKGRLKLDLSPKQSTDLVVSAEKTKQFKRWLDGE